MTSETWQVNGPESIDVGLVRRVRASLMGGSVNVVAHDDASCRVEVDGLTGRDLKVELDGDTLTIDHPQLDWQQFGTSVRTLVDGPSAEVYVLVPRRCDVNVKATSAEVLVAGVEGEVSISTVSGEQFADQTGGTLALSSVSGNVTAREHAGRVDAKTTTGDITVSGTLLEYTGNTVSGSAVVDLLDAGTRQFTHNTVSGRATVRLAAGTNPSYNIQTVTATTHIGDDTIDPLHGRRHREQATGDGDSLFLRLNSVAGSITVVEAETNEPAASAAHRVDDSPVDFSNAPKVQRVNEPEAQAAREPRSEGERPDVTGFRTATGTEES
ncbi:DUF4097 family beta strand repeat-containing protein [Gulosibacter sediminis]|uniref:DUF4097 family beta strand repeat-containing protein n=1 Tax=Gulosibacter sediminis TaxID=1729695 RepID=UPI0024AD2BBC|nr:DUF4097 family beta strand repeat-containing protein [Gulosibacter sediminis]